MTPQRKDPARNPPAWNAIATPNVVVSVENKSSRGTSVGPNIVETIPWDK